MCVCASHWKPPGRAGRGGDSVNVPWTFTPASGQAMGEMEIGDDPVNRHPIERVRP